MKYRLTKLLLLSSLIFLPALQPQLALAASAPGPCGTAGSKGQVLDGVGQTTVDQCNEKQVNDIISTIVSILSYVVGIVAVIMVIVAGIKFVTSGGDSNGVAGAKSTLIYALVGIAVAALAQVLVHFVLSNAHT